MPVSHLLIARRLNHEMTTTSPPHIPTSLDVDNDNHVDKNYEQEQLAEVAANTPLPFDDDLLSPPNPRFTTMFNPDSPRDSMMQPSGGPMTPNHSSSLLNEHGGPAVAAMPMRPDTDDAYGLSEKDESVPRPLYQRSRRRWLWLSLIGALVIAAAVAVPVGVVVGRNKSNKSSSSNGGGSNGGNGGDLAVGVVEVAAALAVKIPQRAGMGR